MKTVTITEAKKQLGALLRSVVAGEEIGIISGSNIIALRKVEVTPAIRYGEIVEPSDRIMEAASALGNDWIPDFPVFDGGPVDGAANHDAYIYDKP